MNMFMLERCIYTLTERQRQSSESKTPLLENGKSIKFQNGYILQIKKIIIYMKKNLSEFNYFILGVQITLGYNVFNVVYDVS